jgi:hypothetical protein
MFFVFKFPLDSVILKAKRSLAGGVGQRQQRSRSAGSEAGQGGPVLCCHERSQRVAALPATPAPHITWRYVCLSVIVEVCL